MDATTSTAIISVLDLMNLSKDLAQLNLGYLGISVTILALLGGVFVYFNIKPLKDSLEKQEATIKDLKKDAEGILDLSRKESEEKFENFKQNQVEAILSLLNQEN